MLNANAIQANDEYPRDRSYSKSYVKKDKNLKTNKYKPI